MSFNSTGRPWLEDFLFAPEPAAWLGALRVGVALTLLLYCSTLYFELPLYDSFGLSGLSGRELSEVVARLESPVIPILDWVIAPTRHLGVSADTTILTCLVILNLSGIALFLGVFSRSAAFVCWILHLMFAKSSALFAYGVENFITIGLFYLMLAPTKNQPSLGRAGATSQELTSFFRHVLQVHLCLIYFFGGLTKAIGSAWWDGLNLWRALTRPPFNSISLELVTQARPILPALGISVWMIELSFALFIWPRETRALWLGLIISLHTGIALAMGMYLFATAAIVLNLAAFYPFAESRKQSEALRSTT